MNKYQLFPDICLICGTEKTPAFSGIEITYCFDGVREYFIDGGYYYLTAGSYIILSNNEAICSDSPGFRGITVIIDNKKVPEETGDMLFNSRSFTDTLTGYTPYIAKADMEISKLFCDAGKFCKSAEIGLLRIRVIEALMLISNGIYTVPADKSGKAMAAADLICSDIITHYTIPQLAEYSQLNPTTFKESFRLTFGCSVYFYAKCRKMFRASELLVHTDMKIINIAEEVGYCNASKFAKAFCDVIGTTPKHFRMEHKKSLKEIVPCGAAFAAY